MNVEYECGIKTKQNKNTKKQQKVKLSIKQNIYIGLHGPTGTCIIKNAFEFTSIFQSLENVNTKDLRKDELWKYWSNIAIKCF